MFDILYNGASGRDHGVAVAERPVIPSPERRYTAYEIAGRDGSLFEFDGTFEDIEIELEMNFVSERREDWSQRLSEIRRWLLGDGDRRLRFSDSPGTFYRVRRVTLTDTRRSLRRAGELTAVFLCDPYLYFLSGTYAYSKEEVLFNPYERARPVYLISGNGKCTLTVNGNPMTATVTQRLTVDTDRFTAFRDNASMNTVVTGNYEDAHLLPGQNTISLTDGFTLSVIPNWRTL